jgi:hypothetical protein
MSEAIIAGRDVFSTAKDLPRHRVITRWGGGPSGPACRDREFEEYLEVDEVCIAEYFR